VIVRAGQIVGEGYHRGPGAAHAEVDALRVAGDAAQGADLYVTLEPCNHHGRTPPCTEAILAAGIARVFYTVDDPNPHVAGGGAARLAAAGVPASRGLCAQEARYINRFFFHHITTSRPYVIAKFAASLDGRIATRTGDSRWITGEAARARVHLLRNQVDAILVGAGTALTDDPALTTRLPGADVRHPLRVVLDSRGRVPLHARLFSSVLPGTTLVATTEAMPEAHRQGLSEQGVEVVTLPATPAGRVELRALLECLGRRNVMSMVVEGGSEVLGAFFDARLVDEVWAFLAPLIIGGQAARPAVAGQGTATLADGVRLHETAIELLEGDVLLRGLVVRPATDARMS
jgi:diaminohydroxyphosphoribosylaminopyrimidine deaminase/5-amino-6-(5-phosphoribosylamino)uracil reductase